ncbi:hypothetical protein HD554DRAFT_1614353 [Boletus coccyginus]|nr:hypothetical protein HD554DRAFT_1614353 [Boletus coccyginus]
MPINETLDDKFELSTSGVPNHYTAVVESPTMDHEKRNIRDSELGLGNRIRSRKRALQVLFRETDCQRQRIFIDSASLHSTCQGQLQKGLLCIERTPQRQCDSSSLRFYRKEATINHTSHPDSRGPKKDTTILDIGVLPREETVLICMIVYPGHLHPLPPLSYDETAIRRTLHSRPRFRSDFYILRLELDCARSSILHRVFHLVLVREYQDGTRGCSFFTN